MIQPKIELRRKEIRRHCLCSNRSLVDGCAQSGYQRTLSYSCVCPRDLHGSVLLRFSLATPDHPAVVHGLPRVGTLDGQLDQCRNVRRQHTTAARLHDNHRFESIFGVLSRNLRERLVHHVFIYMRYQTCLSQCIIYDGLPYVFLQWSVYHP